MVRMLSAVVVPLALSVVVSGTALAASVVSTPIILDGVSGGSNLVCRALNAGTKAADITMEIVDANTGTALYTAPYSSVGPGKGVFIGGLYPLVASTYCRVTGVASKKLTVSYSLLGTSTLLMTVTVP